MVVERAEGGIKEAYWWEAEKQRSPRLNYLRKAAWSKGGLGGILPEGVLIDTAKTYWWTKTFAETDDDTWRMRRAKALAAQMDNMAIFIVDHAQLVGFPTEEPHKVAVHPETNIDACWDFFYERGSYIPKQDREWVEPCFKYWDKMCYRAQCDKLLTAEERDSIISMVQFAHTYLSGLSSANINYDFVFKHGMNGILELIDKELEEADRNIHSGTSTPEALDIVPKIEEWQAMKLVVNALIRWAGRYSRLAMTIAENFETDAKRKAELLRISEICAKVPANPPEHFQEAMQAHHFIMVATKYMERAHTGQGVRIDQIWWPYYKKDVIDEKILTHEEAIDLLGDWQCTVLGIDHCGLRLERGSNIGVSFPVITIGGVTGAGKDACNDLTDAVLEAARLTRVANPTYVFRYHPSARLSTLRSVFETIRHGMGYPSIQNDTVLTETLLAHYQCNLEEARSYANVVCLSPGITTGRGGQAVKHASYLSGVKAFEVAMHNGLNPVLGVQAGPETGDMAKCKTFDEVWENIKKQFEYQANIVCRMRNLLRVMEIQYLMQPLLSACYSRCIDTGIDCVDPRNGEVSNAWMTFVVWNDVGDCLYGIKKLVFEDKKYTMEQLMEALRANWEGYEQMRVDFASVPKWGNDIEGPDEMNVRVTQLMIDLFHKNLELDGYPYLILPENGPVYAMFGPMVGALPNGRRLGDPCYDGGNSPGAGLDKKGPTAVLRSVAKLDYGNMKNDLLNQRLSQTQLSGEKGFELWSNYLKAWHDMGIPHVQFNCVDTDTLRAAQREPEKYSELIVRVAGYSAHFTELSRSIQDSVVGRTLQEL